MAVARRRLRWAAIALVLAGVAAALAFPASAARAAELPLFALFSVSRMAAAYLLALVFAIAFGITAATNKSASVVMLPVLDVLQSVPILAFFPAALVFFVSTFHGHPVGLELAVVFLIFTSMSWNMAFGVYESLTTLPRDLEDAAASFGLNERLRFRRLAFPAMVPKLVYNSMLSWSNGWFFLVASEVFTAFGATYARPGLGAFLAQAGLRGDSAAIALGLGALASVVLTVDAFVWRPVHAWSDRFRIEPAGRELPRMTAYERLRWFPTFPQLRRRVAERLRPLLRAFDRMSARLERVYGRHPQTLRTIRRADLAMFLVIFAVVVSAGLVGLARLLLSPLPAAAADIPAAALLSFSRLAVAYGLALGWTIPAAAWIGRHEKAARIANPALEVLASVPATALLPVIVGFSIAIAASPPLRSELAALLIVLFSMQWYLVFNLIDGVRSLPGNLDEAARSFGVRGVTYWRRVLLPAMVPSLVTGSITAWGAGWNALIVAEFINFGKQLPPVQGLGGLMDRATFGAPPDNELLLLAILAMIVVVLAMNKVVWRPLFRRASTRYRVDIQ